MLVSCVGSLLKILVLMISYASCEGDDKGEAAVVAYISRRLHGRVRNCVCFVLYGGRVIGN